MKKTEKKASLRDLTVANLRQVSGQEEAKVIQVTSSNMDAGINLIR